MEARNGANHAEREALDVARELQGLVAQVDVPAAAAKQWLPERMSFLLARENFRCCLDALDRGDDIPAGNLARALFEEAIRWSWVDEDQDDRRTAFLGAAAHRHAQVEKDAAELGVDARRYYGPLVDSVLEGAEDAARFPRQIEGQLEWGLGSVSRMLYAQYRLLSQYTHSSLLAAASVIEPMDGQLVNSRRLPQVARMTLLRNAVTNMAVIVNGCKEGLDWPSPPPLQFLAMSYAASVAELLQPYAPATS